jgi:hypothetical protein
MILRFTSKNTNDVIDLRLDLLDNEAVHSWAKYAVLQKATLTAQHWNVTAIANVYSISYCIEKCTQAIEELGNLDLHCPFPVPDEDRINQGWCNQAHRWFTHESAWLNNNNQVNSPKHRWLQQLNHYIHKLEDNFPSQAAITEWEDEILAVVKNAKPGSGWWNFPLNEEVRKDFHSADHYHVILTSEILGKSTLKSYADGDNPLDWDTSGHSTSFGGINICLTNHRQRIYQSDDFQQWLDRNSATSKDVYYDFPIGNIINIKDAHDLISRMHQEDFILTYHEE